MASILDLMETVYLCILSKQLSFKLAIFFFLQLRAVQWLFILAWNESKLNNAITQKTTDLQCKSIDWFLYNSKPVYFPIQAMDII